MQHRGVGEVVRREQLGQQRDALVRVRVQLAHGARGVAAALAGVPRAAAATLSPVHCTHTHTLLEVVLLPFTLYHISEPPSTILR